MNRAEQRDNFISNICDYNPRDKAHQVLTIQIVSRAEWQKLGLTLIKPALMKHNYILDLLNDLDLGLGNTNGELRVSLLRQRNSSTGWYNSIYIIRTSPHRDSVDGHLVDSLYNSDSPQHHVIQELFDQSSNAIIEEWTVTHILQLFANDDDAGYLIERYFSSIMGFNSMRLD